MHLPSAVACNLQDVQVQPAQTKAPLSVVAIGALEIRASGFLSRRDVPAAAALVGKNRNGIWLLSLALARVKMAVDMVRIRVFDIGCPAELGSDILNVCSITGDTAEAVGYAEGGLVQLCQLLIDAEGCG